MAVSYCPKNNKPRPWAACWFVWVGPHPPRIRKKLHLGYFATKEEALAAEAEWKEAHGK